MTNPASLLDSIDMNKVREILGSSTRKLLLANPEYVEPGIEGSAETASLKEPEDPSIPSTKATQQSHEDVNGAARSEKAPQQQTDTRAEPGLTTKSTSSEPTSSEPSSSSIVSGKVCLLPDFVDTDALAPAEAVAQPNITKEQLGTYCLQYTHPDFRKKVKELGQNIVVAGEAFGCGSSREDAVFALQGAGVKCVIAKSFAFIYARNQPNLGLLGFELRDHRFWEKVDDRSNIRIDLDELMVHLEIDDQGTWESFEFKLSPMQRRLMECGGAANAFGRYGKGLWQALTSRLPENGAISPPSGSNFATLNGDTEKAKTEW